MSVTFETAVDRVLGHEGGYVNHPNDPGGETNWGISKRSYPQLDIKALTRDGAVLIYKADFWDRGGMDKIDPAVAFQVFDAAVNHGSGNALRMLQRAVGVADDGHIGPVTLRAVNARPAHVVVMLFLAERIDFWRKLSTWPTFGNGWAGRGAANLRLGAEDTA